MLGVLGVGLLTIVVAPSEPPVGGGPSLLHPMRGGPVYPDRPYGGAM